MDLEQDTMTYNLHEWKLILVLLIVVTEHKVNQWCLPKHYEYFKVERLSAGIHCPSYSIKDIDPTGTMEL